MKPQGNKEDATDDPKPVAEGHIHMEHSSDWLYCTSTAAVTKS